VKESKTETFGGIPRSSRGVEKKTGVLGSSTRGDNGLIIDAGLRLKLRGWCGSARKCSRLRGAVAFGRIVGNLWKGVQRFEGKGSSLDRQAGHVTRGGRLARQQEDAKLLNQHLTRMRSLKFTK